MCILLKDNFSQLSNWEIQRADLPFVRICELTCAAKSPNLVTKTDQNGNAIVPSLRRGKVNKISISPEEIPFEYDITNTMVTIYPYPFGASFINLSTRLRRSAIVQLQDASGKVLPAGSEVTFEGAEYPSYVIDFGEVFFEDLPASTTLKVTMGEESCETAIEFPPTDDLQPTLGPFTCS